MRRLVLLPALLAILVGAPPALAWTWPVDGPVLQPFALTDDPYAAGQHRGIDVGAAEGVAVQAPASGTITFAGTVPGGGRSITIRTPDGLAVTLLHLGAALVAEGDTVAEGTHVGVVGWSGDPEHTVPSVHLGVRIATQADGYLDPLSLLPQPAPSTLVAEDAPDEQALAPVVGVEGDAPAPVVGVEDDAPAAPVVEVSILPPQPEEARAAPEALPQAAQPGLAEPADAGVAALEPLVVVSVGSGEPADASASPGDTTTPESPGRAQPHPATVTAAAEAALPALTSAAGDPTRPEKAAAPVTASAPANQSDARRDGQRSRPADRREPVGRPHRVGIDRRAEPFVEGRPAAVQPGAGWIDRAWRFSHDVVQPVQDTGPVRASSGRASPWGRALATILAALAFVLLMRQSGRGGREAARLEPPPSRPALGAAQGDEPDVGTLPAAPAPRHDPHALAPRPGRGLDRGGPGRPAKRPAVGVRGRQASV